MIFVFDLDDTVCNTDSYSEQYIANFIKTNNLPYTQIAKNTRFAESKFDWDKDTALDWYKTYGDQMMAEFPCKEGAVDFINNLYNDGHTIIIATARANDWHTDPVGITKKWLQDNYIKHHKLYIGRVDKELICADENADVFVDDDIKITTKVAEHNPNMQVFLSTTEYNKSLDTPKNVTRIYNLKEIKNHLLSTNPTLE